MAASVFYVLASGFLQYDKIEWWRNDSCHADVQDKIQDSCCKHDFAFCIPCCFLFLCQMRMCWFVFTVEPDTEEWISPFFQWTNLDPKDKVEILY